MSISTTGSKRKIEALGGGRPAVIARRKDAKSVSDPTSGGTPQIPPPVWGHVLDYMPYEEVRSALLVGKIIANEAAKYVRTLNFMKSCQLDGPSARRFPDVEEVNCLSLLTSSGAQNVTVLCKETTIRLVPLLATFFRLRRIFVGGIVRRHNSADNDLVRVTYRESFCDSPQNHNALFTNLCQNFLGAFKARLLLPNIVKTKGILSFSYGNIKLCSKNAERQGMCKSCREICTHFPLQEIFQQFLSFCQCVEEIDVLQTIAKREGAREMFQRDTAARLPRYLDTSLSQFALENLESKEEETLRQRLKDLGVRPSVDFGNQAVWYLTVPNLNYLDRLISVGYDPKTISKKDLYNGMHLGEDERTFDAFAKTTFDALLARGFALDEADLIVLDERMEPALSGLSKRIQEEEN